VSTVAPGRLSPAVLKSFEQAFRSMCSGSVRICDCGRVFYNPDERAWTWDEGELDALNTNPKATALAYAVEVVWIDGKEYAMDCSCWHGRAAEIVALISTHRTEVAKFFRLERERLAKLSATFPDIEAERP